MNEEGLSDKLKVFLDPLSQTELKAVQQYVWNKLDTMQKEHKIAAQKKLSQLFGGTVAWFTSDTRPSICINGINIDYKDDLDIFYGVVAGYPFKATLNKVSCVLSMTNEQKRILFDCLEKWDQAVAIYDEYMEHLIE